MRITIQENLRPVKEGNTQENEDGVKGPRFTGLALPFGKESRNGLKYSEESVREVADTIVGTSIQWNHDDTIPSIGKVTKAEVKDNGLWYELELDKKDELAKSIERKLKNGYIKNVSIQAMVDDESVREYQENPEGSDGVVVDEFVELTICNLAGFKQTTANPQENLAVVTEKMLNPENSVNEELLNKEKQLKVMSGKEQNKENENMSIEKKISELEKRMEKIQETPQRLVISEAMSEDEAEEVVSFMAERINEHLGMAMEEITEMLIQDPDQDQETEEEKEEEKDEGEGMHKDQETEETQQKNEEKTPSETQEGYNPETGMPKKQKKKDLNKAFTEALTTIKKTHNNKK